MGVAWGWAVESLSGSWDESGLSEDGPGQSEVGSGPSEAESGLTEDGSGLSEDGSGLTEAESGPSEDGSGPSEATANAPLPPTSRQVPTMAARRRGCSWTRCAICVRRRAASSPMFIKRLFKYLSPEYGVVVLDSVASGARQWHRWRQTVCMASGYPGGPLKIGRP